MYAIRSYYGLDIFARVEDAMPTVITLIGDSCRKHASRPALSEKIASSWREMSYADLWQEVEQISAGLRSHGFKSAAHAALFAPSSAMWVA